MFLSQPMKICAAMLPLFCLASAAANCHAEPISFSFTPIIAPNPTSDLFAFGINNSGVVVGTVRDSSGATQGFTLTNSQITTFQYPGAASTWAQGVNNNNQIVGYFDGGGYVKNGTSFTAFAPGLASEAYAINDLGQIVVSTGSNAFEITNGISRSLNVPGASTTGALGINDQGVVVGEYDGNGFILNGTTLTTLDFPGAFVTQLDGINSEGEIVGTYTDANQVEHGFVWLDGVFTTLDYPGSAGTAAWGINDNGQVVGYEFSQSGSYDGFLATPIATPEPVYTWATVALLAIICARRNNLRAHLPL